MEKVSSLLLAECYDSLAVSLAGREGHATTWEELQPLVGACMAVAATGDDAVPLRMPRGDNCDALIIGKPTTCLNAREQLAVLALAKFVRASRGQYLRELVPLLIRYLPAIAEYSWAIPRPWTGGAEVVVST